MSRFLSLVRRTAEETISGEVMNEQTLWDDVEAIVDNYGGHCEVEYKKGAYKCKMFLHNTEIGSWFPETKDRDRLFAMLKCIKKVHDMLGKPRG